MERAASRIDPNLSAVFEQMKHSLAAFTWIFVLICAGFWLLLGVAEHRRDAGTSTPSLTRSEGGPAEATAEITPPPPAESQPAPAQSGPETAEPEPAPAQSEPESDDSEPTPFIIQ